MSFLATALRVQSDLGNREEPPGPTPAFLEDRWAPASSTTSPASSSRPTGVGLLPTGRSRSGASGAAGRALSSRHTRPSSKSSAAESGGLRPDDQGPAEHRGGELTLDKPPR